MADLDAFVQAVRAAGEDSAALVSTSTRRSPATAAALAMARDLGLIQSVSGFNEASVLESLRRLAHRAAVDAHYAAYPEDRPSIAELAAVRLERLGIDVSPSLVAQALQVVQSAGGEPSVDVVVGAAMALRVRA